MSEIWGIAPYKSGAQNHISGTTSQLNGNLNGLYLRNETRYKQSGKCVNNYNGSPISPEMSRTWVHKRLQIGPPFYPPYASSAFCFIARLRRWRSANGIQRNFAHLLFYLLHISDSLYRPAMSARSAKGRLVYKSLNNRLIHVHVLKNMHSRPSPSPDSSHIRLANDMAIIIINKNLNRTHRSAPAHQIFGPLRSSSPPLQYVSSSKLQSRPIFTATAAIL